MADNWIAGWGRFIFTNGSLYDGEVLNGLPDGMGSFEYPTNDEREKYEGGYLNGRM